MAGIQVPITKAKGQFIEVDLSETDASGNAIYNDEVYQHIVMEGLKVLLNARMSGNNGPGAVTRLTGKELIAAQACAMKIANENLADLRDGKVKHSRGKAKSTIPAAVMAEARRLAKFALKDAVRAANLKPSHYDEKAYTAKAKELIENDPYYLKQAAENIEARKTPTHVITLDIETLGPVKPKKAKEGLPPAAMPKPQVQAVHKPGHA